MPYGCGGNPSSGREVSHMTYQAPKLRKVSIRRASNSP